MQTETALQMETTKSQAYPLCIDLDGTLIFTDVTWGTLKQFLTNHPEKIFHMLGWLMQGRACLKHNLAVHTSLDVANLDYNKRLIAYINSMPHNEIYLVTAADEKMGQAVADHLNIFKEVIGSNGNINLRAQAKADELISRFGDKKFVYAGNSNDDLYVWKHSAAAIPVNTSSETRSKLSKMNVDIIEI